MKPIIFRGMTCTYAENQQQYLPLPAYKHDDAWECVSSCWGLSIVERIKVLFTGKIYVTLATFGKPLSPQKVSVDSPVEVPR